VTKTSSVRSQRRLASSRFEHCADEGAELVAPRQAVVADAAVLAFGEDGDGGVAREAGRLVLGPVGEELREAGELGDDPLGLGGEVDVACARERRLPGAVRDDELDRPLEPLEQLADLRLLLRAEDRAASIGHGSTIRGASEISDSA
jgi:hypothetical protein